jgi:cationic peptide transport system ATP-binding protein
MELQRDLGLGFIFISHNLGIVRHISDKVIIMKDGKVVESGKTDVIFNWPKNEYTKKLVDSHQALINRQSN